MADQQNYDVIFIGGGLAAALSGILLMSEMPELSFIILEAHDKRDSSQTWSFQSLPANCDPSRSKIFSQLEKSWLKEFVSRSWSSYAVRFPDQSKKVEIAYHSIRSHEFWVKASLRLGNSLRFGEKVVSLDAKNGIITTEKGARYSGRQLIDARGWDTGAFPVAGYQKFVGLNVTTRAPHGVTEPILMDADVPQTDGFRFLYTLPWDPYRLLIEDTRYSDTPDIDLSEYTKTILAYAETKGWELETIDAHESGALALPSFSKGGNQASRLAKEVPQIGVRAGLFHPTTGYSIYDAILTAENILESCRSYFDDLAPRLESLSKERWKAGEFYRRLNNMLFFAADPSERRQVLERFYEHDEDLIARFYAGMTSGGDKLRIISGRPPIAMKKAIYHFFNRSEVLHG